MGSDKNLEIDSGDGPFVVRNDKEIAQILADLAKQQARITASFNQGNDTYPTAVIAVDTAKQVAYLDIGLDERFNSRLLASPKVVFSKEGGVRIKWTSTHLSAVTRSDGKAIKIALPRELTRIQRREFFRIATPKANPVLCRIPIAGGATAESKKHQDLTLEDVSLGGIGVMVSDLTDQMSAVGTCFDGCEINFPDVGKTSLKLCVRNSYPVTMSNGAVKHRLGLQYMNPSRGNEALIQRYVFNLEREALASAKKLQGAD